MRLQIVLLFSVSAGACASAASAVLMINRVLSIGLPLTDVTDARARQISENNFYSALYCASNSSRDSLTAPGMHLRYRGYFF